jgi:hypothetical protein
VLDVVTASLKTVGDHEESLRARKVEELGLAKTREAAKEVEKERLRRFGYHDPRLDALAGNGIMSELGASSVFASCRGRGMLTRRSRPQAMATSRSSTTM